MKKKWYGKIAFFGNSETYPTRIGSHSSLSDDYSFILWGIQYASSEYINELRKYNFQISMSRKGNPYDNAVCESFVKTLKDEEVYLWEYKTIEDAKKRICYFIRDVYNEKRLHSSLGYRPPNEFEELWMKNQKSTVPCQIVLT